jgi:phospholipase C
MLALAACGGRGGSSLNGSIPPPDQHHGSGSTPIQHVIIIVQENRSFDNLFALFPGADGARRGEEKVKQGNGYVDKWVTLTQHSLTMKEDVAHCHSSFETSYDD